MKFSQIKIFTCLAIVLSFCLPTTLVTANETLENTNAVESVISESTATSSTQVSFDTLKAKVEAAQNGDVITLDAGEYLFTETLTITGKEITFVANENVVFKRDPSFKGTMIRITNDAGLTLSSPNETLIVDGNSIPNNYTAIQRTGLLYTEGKLVIDGAIFQNHAGHDDSYRSPIKAKGTNAYIEFNSGKVRNNDLSGSGAAYSSGGFYLENGSRMVMNGGVIEGNQASNYYPRIDLLWSDSPGAGGILVANGANFTMNGGELKNNKGYGGGILIGNGDPNQYDRTATSESKLKNHSLAVAVFNGGTISGNQGVGGGGISGHGNVDIRIPEDSTLLVDRNIGYQGGGIFVSDWYVDGIGLSKETGKLPIDVWNSHFAGKFVMEGGTVSNNVAHNCGGGVNISTNNATITGGHILNNRAGDQGGGIYVTTVPYVLNIQNAYFADNRASGNHISSYDGFTLAGGTGGGIWFCPTGTAQFYAENGIVTSTNTATYEGTDFWSSKKASNNEPYVINLASRTNSGAKIQWFEDKSGQRYDNGTRNKVTTLEGINKETSLKSVVSEEGMRASKALSKVIVTGNRASKGGGLGSNGSVVFGTDTPLKDLEVIKVWEEGLTPKPITLEVRGRVDATDYLIEIVTLTPENNFKSVVTGLPATIAGKPMEEVIYVKELDNQEFKTTVSSITKSTGSDKVSFKIKRPEFSGLGGFHNVHAEYDETTDIKIKLVVDGVATPFVQNMRIDKDTYEWKGEVNFTDIPINGSNVNVEYYTNNGEAFTQDLTEYTLKLKKNPSGDYTLHIPRLIENFNDPEKDLMTASNIKVTTSNLYKVTVTNGKTFEIRATKKWADKETTHPTTWLQLMKNGVKVTGNGITNPVQITDTMKTSVWKNISKEEADSYTVIEVDENGNPPENNTIALGKKKYEVLVEKGTITAPDQGTSAEYLPFTVTNTPLKEIEVVKEWKSTAGETIPWGDKETTITLKSNIPVNHPEINTPITLNSAKTKHIFTNLPFTVNGKEVTYSVEEAGTTLTPTTPTLVTINGNTYTATLTVKSNGYTITNKEETTSLSVTKRWIGNPGESATINLLADGVKTQTITLNAGNNWNHTFTNLPKYNGQNLITYTLEEKPQTGYTTQLTGDQNTGYIFTNTQELTNIPVSKQWVGTPGESATINLLADGVKTQTITLNAGNNWKHTFTNLPKYNGQNLITYTLEEEPQTGYTTQLTGDQNTGYIFTNTQELTNIPVSKQWVGTEKDSIEVALFADGKRIKTQTITKQYNWKYTFTELPKYVDGKKVTYTVKEKKIEGYTVKITGDQNTGFEITNSQIPDKPKLSKTGLSSNITIILTTLAILGTALLFIKKRKEN